MNPLPRTLLCSVALAAWCLCAWAQGNPPPPVQRARVTVPPEPPDMVPLFNGKDLSGWDGDPNLWSVRNGAIHGETTKDHPTHGNTFLIWTGGTVSDFELRLSVRIHHGNSGIQYRSKHLDRTKPNRWIVSGYQAEVANEPGRAGFLYHERGRGRICLVGEKVVMTPDGKKKVVGSLGDRKAIAAVYRKARSEDDPPWNEYVIIAKGNHLRHWINGVQTIDLVDDDPKGRLLSGIIALQIHAGGPMWVEFKDLRLKRYPPADPAR